jgi:hypothetical protein
MTLGCNQPSTPAYNAIDYLTISTLGNTSDFGDATISEKRRSPVNSATRGVWAAGSGSTNTIDYVTIATLGNAIDFGDLDRTTSYSMFSASSCTRGTFAAGGFPSHVNNISYIQIATTGNAVDFGDITRTVSITSIGNCSNGHGGLG